MTKRRLRVLSSSQISRYECPRRWALAAIEGIKEPTTEAQTRGVDVHAQMESFCIDGTPPTHPLAVAFLPYAPTPGMAAVEAPVRFETPSSPWTGFVDCAYDWVLDSEPTWGTTGRQRTPRYQVSGRPAELASTGVTVISDWKTVGKMSSAKKAEELLVDTAANIYAFEAFSGGAKRVLGRWVYGTWDQETGVTEVEQVWFEFKLKDVVERIITLDAVAADLQNHWQNQTPAAQMPTNTSLCFKYKRRDPKPGEPTGACWYYENKHCNPIQTFSMRGAL